MKNYDQIIIGGGVMGLFTAWELTKQGANVLLLEKNKLGFARAASSGLTRSIRRDYLDPFYRDLAAEAQSLWRDFERDTGCKAYSQCGLINLASTKVTPDLQMSYAAQSAALLGEAANKAVRNDLFQADLTSFDVTGGLLLLTPIRDALVKALRASGKCAIKEDQTVDRIVKRENKVWVQGDSESYSAEKIIICAGKWSEEVVKTVEGYETQSFNLEIQEPQEVRYYAVPKTDDWTDAAMPCFACLDMGVYGHPIVRDYTQYLKVSRYMPRGLNDNKAEKTIDHFVDLFMPVLNGFENFPVTDTDQCNYDFTADQDFIIGPLDQDKQILVATGWNGTGYKFAPWVARYLAGATTNGIADKRFNPQRFFST